MDWSAQFSVSFEVGRAGVNIVHFIDRELRLRGDKRP